MKMQLIIESELPNNLQDLLILQEVSKVLSWFNFSSILEDGMDKAISNLLAIEGVSVVENGNLQVQVGLTRHLILIK